MKSTSEEPVWIGIDLGTQSVRVVALSAAGRVAGAGSAPLSSQRDEGRHEQHPEEWWNAVSVAAREALEDVAPETIRGLAVDGTSGTILLTDAEGRPLTAGLMYDDARAAAEVQQVNRVGSSAWAKSGYHRMQASWGLPKLLWLLDRQPKPLGAHLRVAHQTDFINGRLAGSPVATDTSNALKTGASPVDETWPFAVFEELGVPRSLLPPLVRAGSPLGKVCAAAAAETGIPAGTPIFAGMTDGCAAQIAAGALSPGSWNSVLGTTLVLKGVTPLPIQDPSGVVYSHRSPDGHWLPGGASSAGAGVLSQEFPSRNLDLLTQQAAAREPTQVVAYPLSGQGERFPFHAPEATGFVLGLPRDDGERFAAMLQGVAFLERLAFDYLDLLGAPIGGELRLTGGATRNRYWSQLRADALGRPVTLPENAEPACGMAILAAASGRSLAETAREMVDVREVIEPRAGQAERLMESYLRLVDELSCRTWIPSLLVRHARRRAG